MSLFSLILEFFCLYIFNVQYEVDLAPVIGAVNGEYVDISIEPGETLFNFGIGNGDLYLMQSSYWGQPIKIEILSVNFYLAYIATIITISIIVIITFSMIYKLFKGFLNNIQFLGR